MKKYRVIEGMVPVCDVREVYDEIEASLRAAIARAEKAEEEVATLTKVESNAL